MTSCMPWENGKVPHGYWKKDQHKKEAIHWLFDVKLKWTDDMIKENTTIKVIKEHGLGGLVYTQFKGNAYSFVEIYTNGRIKPWEMKKTPKGIFKEESTQVEAVKWLFEQKLKWTDEDVKQKLSASTFRENGLSSLFAQYTNYYDLLNLAYPNRFNPWEMAMGVPRKYWKKHEHGRKAIEWLCKRLGKTIEEFLNQGTYKDLMENSLSGLYQEYREFHLLTEALFPEFNEKKDKPWIHKRVPNDYWDCVDHQIEAVKWLIEVKLKLTEEEIKQHVCQNTFNEHGFSALIARFDSYFELIDLAYPGRFHPWEIMKRIPKRYENWNRHSRAS